MPRLGVASPAFFNDSRSRIKCEMTPFLDFFWWYLTDLRIELRLIRKKRFKLRLGYSDLLKTSQNNISQYHG